MGFRFRVLGWSLGFRLKDLGFMPPGGYATGVQCRVVCFRIFRLQAAPVPANLLLSGSYSNWTKSCMTLVTMAPGIMLA